MADNLLICSILSVETNCTEIHANKIYKQTHTNDDDLSEFRNV